MSTEPPSEGSWRSWRTARVPALVAALAVAVAFLWHFDAGDAAEVEGSLRAAGPSGTFTFAPVACASLDPSGVVEVILEGEGHNGGAIYLTLDPNVGPAIEVEVPGSCKVADGTDCAVFPVTREPCSRWDVDAHLGSMVGGAPRYNGHLALDCVLEDSTLVQADFQFAGC